MTSLFRNALAVLLVFVSSSALAGETWATGRKVLHSCSYASSYEVEATLSYRNTTLPWGTQVFLSYGWGGNVTNGSPFSWENPVQNVPVSASAAYTWSFTLRGTTATRSSPKYYEHIDFVWRVVLPNGSEFYEKGNNSTWGYYAASVNNLPAPCVSDSNFIGTPQALTVTSVVKW